jgi:hypothetical protein
MRDEEMQAEIEDFLEGFNQPTYRGTSPLASTVRGGQRAGRVIASGSLVFPSA